MYNQLSKTLVTLSSIGILSVSMLSETNLMAAGYQQNSSRNISDNAVQTQPREATIQSPEGSTIHVQQDGTKIIKSADGAFVQVKPDGSKVIQKEDGTTVQVLTDGTKIISKPDGTTVQVKPDGSKIIRKADGTTVEAGPGSE